MNAFYPPVILIGYTIIKIYNTTCAISQEVSSAHSSAVATFQTVVEGLRAGGVAQVVEHLPSKHRPRVKIPIPQKKR
jgi:hypothetical protein